MDEIREHQQVLTPGPLCRRRRRSKTLAEHSRNDGAPRSQVDVTVQPGSELRDDPRTVGSRVWGPDLRHTPLGASSDQERGLTTEIVKVVIS